MTVISTNDVFAANDTGEVLTDSENETFMAGTAVLDITSPLGTLIVGSFNPSGAEHVNDPLNVRALALNDGEKTLVFAVGDLVAVPQDLAVVARRGVSHWNKKSPYVGLAASKPTKIQT